MREIKFRGKSILGNNWTYGLLTKKKIRSNNEIHFAIATGDYSLAETTPVDPETVGEFTGLQDINGVDIYEGDICVFFSDIPSEKFIVVWDTSYCGFYCVNPNDESDGGVLCLVDIKVIGNIHDNPELLKEGESMTKYTLKEQYETDKAYFVGLLDSGYGYTFATKQISNLLKQSKWIGDSVEKPDVEEVNTTEKEGD